MEAKWCFPSSNGGEKRGLNDSGIETFKDNPIKSLAREICQNSLDAALPGRKAIVEFSTFSLDKDAFPDVNGFEQILNTCYDYSKPNKNLKTLEFFKNAINKIHNYKIPMLRISDFNTTGLSGTDWDNLVNSSGASEKSEGKSGSFGIGKSAPFACSEFRTVFYSTLDLNGGQRGKGVSRLISYKLGENPDYSDNLSQGTGYYGVPTGYSIKPLGNMIELDKSFKRTSSGTDIFISAFHFSQRADFKSDIISAVLDGFLIAIWQEKLEVKVNRCIINKNTLKAVIEQYGQFLKNDNIAMCYDLLADENTVWHSIPVYRCEGLPEVLGSISFSFKLRQDGINTVSMVRSSGMKIFDKKRLCDSLRYVGIALMEGELLNSLLRNLENPAHNKWEPERHENPVHVRGILKQIYNSLSQKLNEVAFDMIDDELDIEGAGEYLPDESDDQTQNEDKNSGKENSNKIISIEIKEIKRPEDIAHLETNEIGEDIESIIAGDNNEIVDEYSDVDLSGSNSDKTRDYTNENLLEPDDVFKGKQHILVKSKDIRLFCTNKKEGVYRLIFTPTVNSPKGYISIERIAEEREKMPIDVLSVSDTNLEFIKNKIGYFEFKEGQPCKVDIQIDNEEYSAMEVKLYAYKG